MARRFENRQVLVTGGAGGLGRGIALGFAREGAKLILVDIDEAGMAETAAQIAALGSTSSTHRVNLMEEAEILAFGKHITAQHERIDVLINNAGLAYGEISSSFETLSMEKWLRFFAINSVSPLILAQAIRSSLARARGVIINQTSMASYMPANAYGVTKATLNSMTYGMANLFAVDGVRVNAVAPGIMETPASAGQLTPETYARVQGMQMLKLHGTTEDIVNLHLFLASDDARFITSEIVSCDAGNRLKGWRG